MKSVWIISLMYLAYAIIMMQLWLMYHNQYVEIGKRELYPTSYGILDETLKKEQSEPEEPTPAPSTQPQPNPEDSRPHYVPDGNRVDPAQKNIEINKIDSPFEPRRNNVAKPNLQPVINVSNRPMTTTGPSNMILPAFIVTPGIHQSPSHQTTNPPPIKLNQVPTRLENERIELPPVNLINPIPQPKGRLSVPDSLYGETISLDKVTSVMKQRGLNPLSAVVLSNVNQRLSGNKLRRKYRELMQEGHSSLQIELESPQMGAVHVFLDISSLPPRISFIGFELEEILIDHSQLEKILITLCEVLEKEYQ